MVHQSSPASGQWSRRSVLHTIGAFSLPAAGLSRGAACSGSRSVDQHMFGDPLLDAGVQEIVRRPVFAGARWGMKFSSPDVGQTVCAMRQAELFRLRPCLSVVVLAGGSGILSCRA